MMLPITGKTEGATRFQAQTDALAALDQRIRQLTSERRRLQFSFEAISQGAARLLARGEAPLTLLTQLRRVDIKIGQIEVELEQQLTAATEHLHSRSP